MSNTIRTFIAIELPEPVIASIEKVQNGFKRFGFKMRWTRPDNIHLTLKFLGNIETEDIEKIGHTLSATAKGMQPFSLEAGGVSVFPNMHRPRVLWVGIAGQTAALIELNKALEEALNRVGFPKETRPFRGHLTLGRVKGKIDADTIRSALKTHELYRSDPFRVKYLYLFQSELKPTGAAYTKLIQVPLA